MSDQVHEKILHLQEQLQQGLVSRRDFLRYMTMMGVTAAAAEALAACAPKPTPTATPKPPTAVPPTAVPPTAVPPTAVPPTAAPTAAPTAPAPAAQKKPVAGYMIRYNPQLCTGCLQCAFACADKWMTKYFPEQAKDTINLEFSRIRPMRFQWVDVLNVCNYCTLMKWAEGSDKAPCAQVCPQEAIVVVPEGQGEEGYTGYGYMTVDRSLCIGLDLCGRCLEICEDQFASGISFDPIEKKAQICSRCGGLPACVDACMEPGAIEFSPLQTNGRYWGNLPSAYAELLFMKIYNQRRTV